MQITDAVGAEVLALAGRRCECHGDSCRHHLKGSRCKKGLRGDQWKIYWRSETGGVARRNIEAWCLDCFANNFTVPTERVALVSADIACYARLLEEDHRRAITLRSVLRDSADRVARAGLGRLVGTQPDEVLLECGGSPAALDAAHRLWETFRDSTIRLDLPTPELRSGIHCGEVVRWRNGHLAGDAVEIAARLQGLAPAGRIVLTDPVAQEIGQPDDLEAVDVPDVEGLPSISVCWALPL